MATRLIHINSADRINKSNTTSSNFNVAFNTSELNNVRSIAIKAIRFANTFYNVNASNNRLIYNFNGDTLTMTIPVGQYTLTTLLDYIKAQLLALHTVTMNYTVSTLTSKVSMTFSPNVGMFGDNPIGYMLGFRTVNDDLAYASLTATACPNLSGLNELYVCSPELAGGKLITPLRYRSVLDVVPVEVPFGSIVHHEGEPSNGDLISYSDDSHVFQNLSKININLQDSEGNAVDLNGSEILIVIKAYY